MTVQTVSLHEATRERYLNYALSVITARALPDARDGLKPVQRRILYSMFHELSLKPGGRYRKCAAVVGEVMAKYHPHGDQSIYDALVRMAQSFSLRAPLVDGQGNFGSLDGDPPAAMRYTECKLQPIAEELLTELRKNTVDYRPTYDGQRAEPVVLPAQFPQLLVNGCEGIAVGMATKVPPHNLGEVVDACVALIEDRSLTVRDLMAYVKGPDFPTAGRIIADADTLANIYETGQGTFKLRSTWSPHKEGRRAQIIIDSVPYGQNKSRIIERIGNEVASRKLPLVTDVRDESTEDVRIVLDLKQGASADAVMAYLFRHTPLEVSWSVNMTALVPSERADVATPARLDLREALVYWLDFRFETVRRRFAFELEALRRRIELLEGFEIIFDCLDEAIAIIRASEGKRDAAERLMDRFDLTENQTDAILELRLYKLARLEILLVREELEEKRAEAERIEAILSSDRELWAAVRTELLEIRKLYADKRRTTIGSAARQLTYDHDAYIVKEDAYVVVTRDGWFKRQSSFSHIERIRVREGSEIGWLVKAHTRSTVTLFTTHGIAYVMRVDNVPATTGYGEPVQAHFQLGDGEQVIGVLSNDSRNRLEVQEHIPGMSDDPPPPWAIALTRFGRVLRFSLGSHEEQSTRAGRKYARLASGDRVVAVYATSGTERVAVASKGGRAMLFESSEVPILRAAGKGVTGIKLRDGDEVMCFELAEGSLGGPTVLTGQGRELVVRERKFGISRRGGRGRVVLKRGSIDTWVREPSIRIHKQDTPPPEEETDEEVN